MIKLPFITRRDLKIKLVFIIGAPRSGTTWLWGLLTSFPSITPLLKEDFDATKKTISNGKFKTSETGAFVNYKDSEIKKVILKKQRKFTNKILIEKTPTHIMHVGRILKLFPDSKIIYIQRDPRAVISSMLNSTFFNFADSLEDAIEKYTMYMNAIEPFLDNHNIFSVKYENLYNNTDKYLEEILRFIDIKNSTEERKRAILENNKKTKVNIRGVFRKGTINSYLDDLSEQKIDKIERALRDIINKYDYNGHNGSLSKNH